MKTFFFLLLSASSLLALPVEFRNYSGGNVVVTDGRLVFVLGTGGSRLNLADAKWKVAASNYSILLPIDTKSLMLDKSELVVTLDQRSGIEVNEVDGWWMTFLRGMAFGVSVCGLALITRIIRK